MNEKKPISLVIIILTLALFCSYHIYYHFIDIANGSLYEVLCQLKIANQLGYIQNDNYVDIKNKATRIAMMLGGLRRYYSTKMTNRNNTENDK